MKYAVVCQQVVGGNGTPMTIEYWGTHELFDSKGLAVIAGFKARGSDDFNIAHVSKSGRITALYWMDEKLNYERRELRRIEEAIGLK